MSLPAGWEEHFHRKTFALGASSSYCTPSSLPPVEAVFMNRRTLEAQQSLSMMHVHVSFHFFQCKIDKKHVILAAPSRDHFFAQKLYGV